MAHPRLRKVITEYAIYAGMFVGNGFLAGAIVHFPLNPLRFGIIGAIGTAIFMVCFILNEKYSYREKENVSLGALIFFSLLLALGIGMISGGVQHFDEVPAYASKLIPIGITLSLTGYLLKHSVALHTKQLVKLVVVGVLGISIVAGGLHAYAQSLIAPAKTPESSEQTSEEPVPALIQESESHGDGHGH